jgi:hypothetical protein
MTDNFGPMAVAIDHNYLYVFGGQIGTREEMHVIWMFDLMANSWEKVQIKGAAQNFPEYESFIDIDDRPYMEIKRDRTRGF